MFEGPFSEEECLSNPTFGGGLVLAPWIIEPGSGWQLGGTFIPPYTPTVGIRHTGVGALPACIAPCLYQKLSDMAVPLIAGARYKLWIKTTLDYPESGGSLDLRIHLVDVSDLENDVVRRSHVVIAEGIKQSLPPTPPKEHYFEFYFSIPNRYFSSLYYNGVTWDSATWAIALYGNGGDANDNIVVEEIHIQRDTSDGVSVEITSTAPDPTTQSPIPCKATFALGMNPLAPDNFTAGDIVVTNGAVSEFVPLYDPVVGWAEYTFKITPTPGDFVVVKANIAAEVALDNDSDIPNSAAPEFSRTFYPGIPVEITSDALDPTETTPIPCTVTFEESVTGFTANEIIVTNGTVANFAGSGAVYTFDLVPTPDESLVVVKANIAAGVAANGAGTINAAAPEFSRTYSTGGAEPITVVMENLTHCVED